MQYVWFIWSIIILALWGVVFYFKKDSRKEMLKMSWITMPLGFTEPLFVPDYWHPPSLFDLAEKTGFDIESLIFSFAIGGIGTVLYNLIFKRRYVKIPRSERNHDMHKLHVYMLFVPLFIFLALSPFTPLSHIYCGILAMFLGGLATTYCRPDLSSKIWIGGFLFALLYFIYFGSILPFHPDYAEQYWNLENLSKLFVFGIPIEELLFAFTFGMYWSGLYEHMYWRKLIKPTVES